MDHREAVEKDLLLMTGHSLDDIGRTLSWSALGAFLHKIDISSETARELDPELAAWSNTTKTNALLADIYDMLAMINANICAMGSGKRAKKPESYPRPGDKKRQHIGKNALPAAELDKWFQKKREARNKQGR